MATLSADGTVAGLSIVIIYYQTVERSATGWNMVVYKFGVPYYSLSFAFSVLLMLMIVIRLILHSRNFRNVMGSQATTSGLYKTIATMLVESYALYVINFLLYIGPVAVNNPAQLIFTTVLAQTQVSGVLHFVVHQGLWASSSNDGDE
jgi:hypothetical protein